MLTLYIDGERVNLSDSVHTEFYQRNPFFTNEGDYTLDLDIDLRDPDNARVYGYGHRLDRIRKWARRRAVLQDERGILITGTEIVLDMHDEHAKIQIVAGTSALNYAMGDRTLQELDLYHEFETVEVAYPPVCAYNDSKHAQFGMMDSSEWETEGDARVKKWTIVNRPVWDTASWARLIQLPIPQPYVWAVLEHVITALGFKVSENVLRTDSLFSRMLMVHAIRSSYVADMLPRWKVSEFFDEIQRFFNVIISADVATGEVSVVLASTFLDASTEAVAAGDIIDIKKEFGKESKLTMIDYSACHYEFPSHPLYQYASLPQGLEAACTKVAEQTVSASVIEEQTDLEPMSSTITNNRGVNCDTGALYSSSSYNASGFIDVTGYQEIIYGRAQSNNTSTALGMAFYTDANADSYYSGQQAKYNSSGMVGYENTRIAIPQGVKYVRISINKNTTSFGTPCLFGIKTYNKAYLPGIWKAANGGSEGFVSDTSVPSTVADSFGARILYTATLHGETRRYVLWSVEDGYTALKQVGVMDAKTTNRPGVADVSMKVVPVRMVSSPVTGANGRWWQYPLAAVDGDASSFGRVQTGAGTTVADRDYDINDDIKSGYKEKEQKRADAMFVGIYYPSVSIQGYEDPENNCPNVEVPVVSGDWQAELHRLAASHGSDLFWKSQRVVKLSATNGGTLSIVGPNGMYERYYSQNPLVDTSVAYVVRYVGHGRKLPDVRKVFLVGNRKFYCQQLKYDVSAGRRSEVVEGTFYPLLEEGAREDGETVYYVTYNLTNVIVDDRVLEVAAGDGLDLTLRLQGGGSASWKVYAEVTMGGVDITSTAFTRATNGRSGTVHIGAVTGDVVVRAWRAN